MTLQELFDQGRRRLLEAGIKEAELDARYLLFAAFHLDAARYLAVRGQTLKGQESADACLMYEDMLLRRAKRIPLQYVIGSQEFMGLSFRVNEHVLIPRQDTETLVELVLRDYPEKEVSVLDLCTGSGCIAVSLKKLGEYREVTGADISEEALAVAQANGQANGCRIRWIKSDLLRDFGRDERYDIIVSNPPYIPTDVIAGLEPEVRDYEPMLALDGDRDGLLFYRRLAGECTGHLNPGGSVYFEIGYDQGAQVSRLLLEAGYKEIEIVKDTPGMDRVVKAVLGGNHV